eukprot:scaffold1630_cov228-Alexandrium_tamarense.AAC.1
MNDMKATTLLLHPTQCISGSGSGDISSFWSGVDGVSWEGLPEVDGREAVRGSSAGRVSEFCSLVVGA